MTLSVEEERRRAPRQSERTRLDPFVVIAGDASPRDQRDLMERPFFSLSKSPRTKPILYRANDVEVQVNNPVNRLGRSGAKSIGRSGAALSVEQAHQPQMNPWAERQSRAANLESNRESNSSVLTRAHESGSAGAEFRGPVRNTVGSSPISTASSAEEQSAQDTCDVDRRGNSRRSKR